MKKMLKQDSDIRIFLLIYLMINLLFLTRFPFVHSDEAWLAGLTRNMIHTGNLFTTEPFFNLYPRYPHSIKILFHLFQMPFILFGGYSVFSVRLISLLFSMASLYVFYYLLRLLTKQRFHALAMTILFSLNLQFIYAAHFARQEIILLFLLLLGLYIYLKPNIQPIKQTLLLGCMIGLSIGFHPNSFILALVFGGLYLLDCILFDKNIKNLALLIITVSGFAIVFALLSFLADPQFITHYMQYGASFGVDASISNKLLTLDDFYYKLYHSISGTYYVPPMKIFWISFIALLLINIASLFIKKWCLPEWRPLIMRLIIAVFFAQLGILLIGRYNSTSILFAIPFFYLLLAILLMNVSRYSAPLPEVHPVLNSVSLNNHLVGWLQCKKNKILLGFYVSLILLSTLSAFTEIRPYLDYRYEDYLDQIKSAIPNDAKTLGNLSAGFCYQNDRLLDYRNLAYLKVHHQTFQSYIESNQIEYIVYYEELEYLHNNPKWQVLYGEDDYYEEMMAYLNNSCTLVHSFSDMVYGIRIPKYMMDYPWKIYIYKVNP